MLFEFSLDMLFNWSCIYAWYLVGEKRETFKATPHVTSNSYFIHGIQSFVICCQDHVDSHESNIYLKENDVESINNRVTAFDGFISPSVAPFTNMV